jgi:hypothetical protein
MTDRPYKVKQKAIAFFSISIIYDISEKRNRTKLKILFCSLHLYLKDFKKDLSLIKVC